MYHSKVSDYNIIDRTPFGRDPLKELADANAKNDIGFGFYYSQAQDWHEPGGAGNEWDFMLGAARQRVATLRELWLDGPMPPVPGERSAHHG